MTNDLERTIIDIVAERKTLSPEQISPDSSFADLGIDSLEAIDLIFTIEERFGIMIPDDAARGITSVGEAAAALRRALGDRAAAG